MINTKIYRKKCYIAHHICHILFDGPFRNSKNVSWPIRKPSGPMPFILNDCSLKWSRVFHFADDTNLLHISKTSKKLQKELNYDLKLMNQWLLANKILLNETKTELIIFHKPNKPVKNFTFKIKINGYKIKPSNYIKYLGVYLDNTLSGSFQTQILNTNTNTVTDTKKRHSHSRFPGFLKII